MMLLGANGPTRRIDRVAMAAASDWKPAVVDMTYTVDGGRTARYAGSVLTSRRAKAACAELEAVTSSLRRTTLKVPFIADRPVRVSARVGETELPPMHFQAGQPTLHCYSAEVTELTAREPLTKVHVYFFFESAASITLIADSASGDAPHVEVSSNPARTASGAAFYLGIIALLLAVALLLAGGWRSIGADTRIFTVFATAGALVYSLVKLPKPAALDVRRWLRRGYAASGRGRVFVAAVLLVAATLAWFFAGRIVGALWQRWRYTAAITKALRGDDSELLDAFIRLPWRREAPLLIEASTYRGRVAGDDAYRDYLWKYLESHDARAVQAAKRPFEAFQSYLVKDQNVIANPSWWYLNFRYNAANDKTADTALDAMLTAFRTSKDPDERLDALALDLEESDDAHAPAAAAQLEAVVTHSVVGDYVFQTAADDLAGHYLNRAKLRAEAECGEPSEAARAEIRNDLQRAEEWCEKLLYVRRAGVHSTLVQPFWPPPEKLTLYHLMIGHASSSAKGKGLAEEMLLAEKVSRAVLGEEPSLKAHLIATFPEYATDAAWREGTILAPDVRERIETKLLVSGWEY